MELKLLFEDEFLVCVDKPAGILSQGTVDPKRANLVNLLSSQIGSDVLLLHRLDKDTSGVIIFSKNQKNAFKSNEEQKNFNRSMTDLFREHKIQKTYIAITKKYSNELFKTNYQWTYSNHLAPVKSKGKIQRMVVVKKGGWYAETAFSIMEESERLFKIKALPKTGRTHQIRVHLASQKLPILGDPVYGGKVEGVKRMLLHAQSIEFTHPMTQEKLCIQSELPTDFNLF